MIERNGGLMSVIVKGMKMPKNCLHCDFDDSYGICACRNEAPYVCEYSAKQRPSWCPLEEVPSAQPEPCEDAVSRQAVYNVLDKMPIRGFKKDGETIHGLISLSQVNSAIINLPTAQPETHEERTETHACDLISRKAAIDALTRKMVSIPTAGEKDLMGDVNRIRTEDISVIRRLPSAQPERLTDDDFETIRIHLNAYKEKLCNQHRWEEANEYQRILDRFMAFASAQPEIIRCKDCKLHGTNGYRLNCAMFCCTMPDDGFCSCGERREDG